MKKYNKFITFEGPEASGKSTVIKIVSKELNNLKIENTITREPGGKNLLFCEDVRKVILKHKEIDIISELFLFAASRREHIKKVIQPEIEKGKLVISDRFSDSTLVYQGYGKNLDKKIIKKINDIAVKDWYPDITIIFDLKPELSIKRIKENNRETNRFDEEEITFYEKIREGYLKLAKTNTERYFVVDASQSIENVVKEIMEIILKWVKKFY